MKVLRGFLLTVTMLTGGITPVSAGELNRNFQESFTVSEGSRLHLNHGDGDVSIQPWDKDVLEVRVRYHVKHDKIGLGSDPDFDVEFRQDKETIHVIGREKDVVIIGFSATTQYEYTYQIQAPAYLELDLEGDDGDVRISGWRGDIRAENEDGDFVLSDITTTKARLELEDGDLSIQDFTGALDFVGEDGEVELLECHFTRCDVASDDGDIIVRDSTGEFSIETEDGDVQMRRCHAGEISVSSDDGEIHLELLKHEDLDLQARTEDGDILVEVEPGTSAEFSIETDAGEISLDLPGGDILSHDDERATGTLGGGQGRIRLQTDDGDVKLRES